MTGSELAALGYINGLFLAGRFMEETIPRIREGSRPTVSAADPYPVGYRLTSDLNSIIKIPVFLVFFILSRKPKGTADITKALKT